jgi:glycerol kinase
MPAFKLGAQSLRELERVHSDLVAVVNRAVERSPQPFAVHDGIRSIAEQKEMVARGASQTMASRHLTGHAVDLVPVINGKLRWEWPAIYPIADAMRVAAIELNVRIIWGGAWDVLLTDTSESTEDLVGEYTSRRRAAGKLSGGRSFATDASNASRTMLFDLRTQQWDDDLLALFRVPRAVLPEVRDSNGDFGRTDPALFGAAMPIRGVLGDQQAALVGQACFAPGMIKSTYGTGCFVVMNTGGDIAQSRNRLLSTVAYRIDGVVTYAIEGSIFVAGATVQWLRDSLKLIENAAQSEAIASRTGHSNGVYLVPAFTGLGAPHWDPHARGAILGLTRDTGIGEIVTAGLESVCFQTRDLLEAMQRDGASGACTLRIDGGMAANNWLAQSLADILGVRVDRPQVIETTALGAAYMAGLGAGIYPSLDDIAKQWQLQQGFAPQMAAAQREALYRGWLAAIARVLR